LFRKKHRTTAAQVNCSRTEYVLILKTLFPQKLSDMDFTYPTSTVRLQLLNLWLPKVMLRCVSHSVTTTNPGHQTSGNACVIWSDESSFTLSLHQEEFTFGEQPRKPTTRNAWVEQWNKMDVLWCFGQQYRGTVFC
jgi:hypothetical protein